MKDSLENFYRIAQNIVQQIMSHNDAFYFFKPVDPEVDCAPDYYSFVTEPMCLFFVQQKIDNNEYENPQQFINDMHLIWQNAKSYNHPTTSVYKSADALAKKFELLASQLPQFVTNEEKYDGVQRLIELNFLRYRMNKNGHQ